MPVKFKADDGSLTDVDVISVQGNYTVVAFNEGVLRGLKASVFSRQLIGDVEETAVETKFWSVDQELANIQVDAKALLNAFSFDKFTEAGVQENAVDDFLDAHRALMQAIHNMQTSRVLKKPTWKMAGKADL